MGKYSWQRTACSMQPILIITCQLLAAGCMLAKSPLLYALCPMPLLRNIRQSSYLAFVVSESVLLLVLVHNVIVRHQRNFANICGYDVHGLG